jgi:hypothetical protein
MNTEQLQTTVFFFIEEGGVRQAANNYKTVSSSLLNNTSLYDYRPDDFLNLLFSFFRPVFHAVESHLEDLIGGQIFIHTLVL